jgi:hypothetical protein
VKIDVLFSEPHYARHMIPIWAALPDELRGDVHEMYPPGGVIAPRMGRWAMVAGWQDVSPLRGRANMIYVEHGAGQTYVDRPFDPSYSGSRGQRHRGVQGYICPSQTVADRWDKPAIAVGCPKMDRWLNQPAPKLLPDPTVCFAWHWDCQMTSETRSAWAHYQPLMPQITERFGWQGFNVVGHAHPKWDRPPDLGVPMLSTEDEVFATADVLVVDNSSLAYEAALLGIHVICLNAPWYRRDVEHGLRFWSHVPGLQIDEPEDLLAVNLWDLLVHTTTASTSLQLGQAAVQYAYATTDGTASAKAAAFIEQLVDGK